MFDRKKFKAQMALAGITAKELSSKIGMDESTFYRKLNDEGRFSRKEINDMIQILGIGDPREIFFAKELA